MSTFARNRRNHITPASSSASSSSSSSPAPSSSSSSASSSSTSAPVPTSSSSAATSSTGTPDSADDLKSKQCFAQKYLTNCKSLYSCIHCRTHLANHDELVSRSFQGNHGRAYLFNSVINISCGPPVQRLLNTGSHAVADIYCSTCEKTLGWKYEKAYVETQKYKEGKYIIELAHVVRENRHLELDKGEIFLSRQLSVKSKYKSKCNNNTSNIQLAYSSRSSPMSSPADSAIGTDLLLEDDDDELMFPFYDDLCASRSSYPGNLSMSHHDRARRSLYLESKPYDWKNSPASSPSSTSSPRLRSTTNATDSALSSDDLPSPSSSSASRSECCHADDDEDNEPDVCHTTELFKASKRPKHDHKGKDNDNDNNQDDSETQFKLDDDLPQLEVYQAPAANRCHRRSNDSITDTAGNEEEASTASNNGIGGPSSMEHMKLDNNNRSSSPGNKHTINLDDEEFFDCYSEHDVLNLLVWPESLNNGQPARSTSSSSYST